MTTNQKIHLLRQAMQTKGLDAYLIPSSDPHQSEYVAEHWQSRQWISGFTGSAGLVIVTKDHAGLWTDSRYFLQAETELADTEMQLHKQGTSKVQEHVSWLQENLSEGSVLGVNGSLFSAGQIRYLEKHLKPTGIKINHQADLIAEIWQDRPTLPTLSIFEYDIQFTGESRAAKLQRIRAQLTEQEADFHLITTLDDIAWTLNIRGGDVACNPVAIAYLIIGLETAYLFINPIKIPDAIKRELNKDGVIIKPYDTIETFLRTLDQPISVDNRSANIRLYDIIPDRLLVRAENIPQQLKARKNATEIKHLREAMRKDGVALIRFFRWLEQELNTRTVSEYEAGRQLNEYRKAQGDYFGESFTAIVGYNANGAIVHYRPDEKTSAAIKSEGILLLDSGGQYLQGTTDITRTIALSAPTDEQRRDYTLVLKGHIALATAKFPEGTTGVQLDTFARMYLWQHGLNFGHGTGHGVGFFLNVHEPPQGFVASPGNQRGNTPHEPGMLTSNEPGFYKNGAYGIRIENLVLCTEAEETEFGQFLQFDTLTLFPIDTTLIDTTLMTQEERQWLNDYHHRVFNELASRLAGEEVEWLRRKCDEI